MTLAVGQREILTQKRVIAFCRDVLDYAYMGKWKVRAGNSIIEVDLLTAWLLRQGHSDKSQPEGPLWVGQGGGPRRKA